MLDNFKKILNEDQDPKAIEKITSRLDNLLMTNEEVGYIAVQKKPAVTIFPDSIVVTNKRIIICKPKNLGLSMEFIDYDWDDVAATFVKEGILGAEFTFTTKSDLTQTIDYLPKKNGGFIAGIFNENAIQEFTNFEEIAEVEEDFPVEEVTNFAEIIPVAQSGFRDEKQFPDEEPKSDEVSLKDLSQDELFDKLQNYKKLLDNGLILQGEYDKLKAEIIKYM
jgi:hypothetical protein